MNGQDALTKALFMLRKCRVEGVEPLGWGINPAVWDDIWANQPDNLLVLDSAVESKLYGLPVEVSDVYADIAIRII
jgi:hypothetical protein